MIILPQQTTHWLPAHFFHAVLLPLFVKCRHHDVLQHYDCCFITFTGSTVKWRMVKKEILYIRH